MLEIWLDQTEETASFRDPSSPRFLPRPSIIDDYTLVTLTGRTRQPLETKLPQWWDDLLVTHYIRERILAAKIAAQAEQGNQGTDGVPRVKRRTRPILRLATAEELDAS